MQNNYYFLFRFCFSIVNKNVKMQSKKTKTNLEIKNNKQNKQIQTTYKQ